MDCTIVDVFAERPLAGNQLAVVRKCAHLSTAAMQAIALETNFSETTFVTAERDGEADVRIFTPAQELPSAGHPTLGTAWVLGRERGDYALCLEAGRVPVWFGDDGIAWLTAPAVEPGAVLDLRDAAALVGVGREHIDPFLPPRFASAGGLGFVFIGLRGHEALREACIDARAHAGTVVAREAIGVFLYCPGAPDADSDFRARMFFQADGWREDPATGSANAALAGMLRSAGRAGRVTVAQGVEMGRPSRVYLDIGETIRVGGRVQPVMTGTLHLPEAAAT